MSLPQDQDRDSSHATPQVLNGTLSLRQQTSNLVRFGVHMGLIYLAAPVIYVGRLDAILLDKLGFSNTVANLPTAAYYWGTAPFLVLFTWFFCQVRMLKPVLIAAYAIVATSGTLVLVGLFYPHSNWLVAALVVRAVLTGWFMGVVSLFEWEVLARGVDERRRGFAMSIAFGLGPVMAVLSSFGTQLVLDGRLGPITIDVRAFPWDYCFLFGASVLIMAVPAVSATRYHIPSPTVEVQRTPLISGVFGGFGDFLRNPLLMGVSIAFLLTAIGNNTILPNVVLYSREAIGEDPQKYAGYQFVLEFAFKSVAGLLLGWMLTRTKTRNGLVATTSFCLAGVLWALLVRGEGYLIIGLLGAGELYYAYYQNYLVACSPKSMVRRNLVYAQLVALPVCLAPIMFGWLSDAYGLRHSLAAR